MHRIVQSLKAEVSLKRVGDVPRQNFPGEPVHDGDEIEKTSPHGNAGDVVTPDLIGPVDPQSSQQVE